MKRRNGFTLIELLAVIIILGILMIIAIPSVTSYINNSRKSAYVDTAKEIVSGARNFVNEGKLEMYATDTTYYITAKCIKTENGQKSPYGDFDDNATFVIVTFDGKNFNYYWVSRDTTGQGVSSPILANNLSEDSIESDISSGTIQANVGIGSRTKIQVIDANCEKDGEPTNAVEHIAEEGANGGSSGGNTPAPTVNKICKRPTSGTEHTATCTASSDGCYAAGYRSGGTKGTTTITYGTIKSTGSTLESGDALDCDVNNDGTYDSVTERFYYVIDNGNNAVLIYYTNVYQNNETLTSTRTQKYAYYGSTAENWHGPQTGYAQLPTTTQWSNSQIIAPVANRQIVTETGTTSTSGGTIEQFTYTDKAARFLTYQEVQGACGSGTVTTTGYLDGCNYLMENLERYETGSGTYGYWLETTRASYSIDVWNVYGSSRRVGYDNTDMTARHGVRPAIEVLKSNIEN